MKKVWLFIVTLIILTLFINKVSLAEEGILFEKEVAQKILRELKECDLDRRELQLRQEQDALKDQRIANLEKELDLAKQELALKDRIIAIKDMEISAQKQAFTDMKEIADRALKLAEVGKPKSNWELQGLIGLAVFVAGILIAK